MKKRTAVLDAVKRAVARSASVVHGEMKRGIDSLASIAVTAPLVGLFGTVLGILNAFRGGSTEKTSFMKAMANSFSESLAPTALGLLVAVLAFGFYKYLSARLDNFDIEMQNASLELVDRVSSLLGSTHS